MHSLYAYLQSKSDNIPGQEKFLLNSIDKIYDLFLLQFQMLVSIHDKAIKLMELSKKKHLATSEDINPNQKFVNNSVLKILSESEVLKNAINKYKLDNWEENHEYVNLLFNDIVSSERYEQYMSSDTTSFKEDKLYVEDIFKEIIAPNEKLYSYFEDNKLTWINDYPLVNTSVLKLIKGLKSDDELKLPSVYKNAEEDEAFALQLFRRTLKYQDDLIQEIEGKTPNWESDRITLIDGILLRMAICEFLHFPSIPVKVTINEYLEIAKEYATPKSSGFINGILDNLVKDYKSTKKLNKSGRGLL